MAGRLATAEAVLGTPLTPSSVAKEMGVSPSMFKSIRQRAEQRRAREKAEDKGSGLSTSAKVAKSIAGGIKGFSMGGPTGAAVGMAEPWIPGKRPGIDAVHASGATGVFGVAGADADARAAALQGRSQPGYVGSAGTVGGMVPVTGAGRGLIGESGGISPQGAGRLGLEAALSFLGATLASPLTYAGGMVGSTGAREYTKARAPDNQRAQFYAGLGGGVVGGIAGGIATPESWAPSRTAFGDTLDKVVNAPGAFIRPAGNSLGAIVGRSAVNALPSTGSVTGDLLGRLQALRRRRNDELLAKAYNPLSRVPGTAPVINNPYA